MNAHLKIIKYNSLLNLSVVFYVVSFYFVVHDKISDDLLA